MLERCVVLVVLVDDEEREVDAALTPGVADPGDAPAPTRSTTTAIAAVPTTAARAVRRARIVRLEGLGRAPVAPDRGPPLRGAIIHTIRCWRKQLVTRS